MFGFVVGDQLGDFGIRADRLDQNVVVRVEEHAIRTVHLIAAPHQNVADGLGLLIHRTLDVIHIGQLRIRRARVGQLAKVNLIVVQQNRGVRVVISGPFSSRAFPQALAVIRIDVTNNSAINFFKFQLLLPSFSRDSLHDRHVAIATILSPDLIIAVLFTLLSGAAG